MISEITSKHLTKFGWHTNRTIDVTKNVDFLESLGYIVFDKAKQFMEEYGELSITNEYVGHDNLIYSEHHSTCINDLFFYKKKYDLDNEVGEKTIPVFLKNDEVIVYISESGKFYRDVGLLYESSDELWDSIYTENGVLILTWDKIRLGEKQVKRKQKIKNYIL